MYLQFISLMAMMGGPDSATDPSRYAAPKLTSHSTSNKSSTIEIAPESYKYFKHVWASLSTSRTASAVALLNAKNPWNYLVPGNYAYIRVTTKIEDQSPEEEIFFPQMLIEADSHYEF